MIIIRSPGSTGGRAAPQGFVPAARLTPAPRPAVACQGCCFLGGWGRGGTCEETFVSVCAFGSGAETPVKVGGGGGRVTPESPL